MAMEDTKVFRASEYNTRKELETAIGGVDDISGYTIVGTMEELKALFLSHGQNVNGVPIIAFDYKADAPVARPSRGKVMPHGLNGHLKDANGKVVDPPEVITKETE